MTDTRKSLPMENVTRLEVVPVGGVKNASGEHFIRIRGANHEKGFLGETSRTRAASKALAEAWAEILNLPVWVLDYNGKRIK